MGPSISSVNHRRRAAVRIHAPDLERDLWYMNYSTRTTRNIRTTRRQQPLMLSVYFVSFVCSVLMVCLCHPQLEAQRRDTPLAQVNVPHSYYWREMYIPQVTSGPGSFAWSPDGHEVIYSMQGS